MLNEEQLLDSQNMEYGYEIASSLTFASSSYSSNGCGSHLTEAATTNADLENLSLSKLSRSLEKLLVDEEYDYSDAEIVVEDNIGVGINKCILAARSQYFHELFKKERNDSSRKEEQGKPKYLMSELLPYGRMGREAFKVFLNYLYTGKVQPSSKEVSTCVDDTCSHDACSPLINYALELMYASVTFQMKELVSLVQRHLLDIVKKALVEDVIPILVAAFHYQLNQLLSECIQRVATSDLDSVSLEKEVPQEVYGKIRSLRLKHQQEAEPGVVESDPILEKRIRRIHKALDSSDVELVKLLLKESNLTLDDACALHYAAAYCDPKIVNEVLSLGLANVNLRNPRGYTALHAAARRKEPSVLVALLNKGACVAETTFNGQTALDICRRLTRLKDYNENKKQGEISNKDRLCIGVLEREMRNSESENLGVSSHVIADDLVTKQDYYEIRVSFARLLYPAEAKVAMEIADADSNIREVHLNEPTSIQAIRLQLRLQTLFKTVETGKRYFPHCAEVLDKFLVDDMSDPSLFEEGSSDEQIWKRRRFTELKDELLDAFYKDKADQKNNRRALSPSSSSTAKHGGARYKPRRN